MQTQIVRTWLSYKEAEQLVGLSRTTLWKLIGSGEVEHRRIGRTVKISRESLEEYMRRPAGSAAVGAHSPWSLLHGERNQGPEHDRR